MVCARCAYTHTRENLLALLKKSATRHTLSHNRIQTNQMNREPDKMLKRS